MKTMLTKKLVLASASPRRIELLKTVGVPFKIDPSTLKENLNLPLPPEQLAMHWAEQKALSVSARHPNRLILAADTIGVLGNKILGKPKNRNEAIRMLQALSGKTHRVITGFTLLNTKTGHKKTAHAETKVTFKRLTHEEIEAYVDTGEPMDKAAAYAIQGGAAKWIKKIKGERDNVIGLPLQAVKEMLQTLPP